MPKKPKAVQVRDAYHTQQKILAAAEAEFAEKGFDGGRVDEIAKRAGVNKAMLYYYFQSKEQLLRALTEKHFKEIAKEKKQLLQSYSADKSPIAKQVSEQCIKLLSKRKAFLRILAIEAFKNDQFAKELFRMIDAVVPHLNTISQQTNMNADKLTQLKTNIFFFGFTPLLMYLTIGENWTEYAGMDQQLFQQTFLEALHKQNDHTIGKQFALAKREK